MKFLRNLALGLALVPGLTLPALAEVITCSFVEKEPGRTLQITLQGDPATGEPAWQAIQIFLGSQLTHEKAGAGAGKAEETPDLRVAEVALHLYQWNGQSGLGVGIHAAPAMHGVAFGLQQFSRNPDGTITPEPVWGKLRVDDQLVLSGHMEVFELHDAGPFLRLPIGYLGLPDSEVPFGVDPKAEAALTTLLKSRGAATLDLYPYLTDTSEAPSPLVASLVSFEFAPGVFARGQARAQGYWAEVRRLYDVGCPDNLYTQ